MFFSPSFLKHYRQFIIMNVHDVTPKNPKEIFNFFSIFFLVYEKEIHVKNNGLKFRNLSIIIMKKLLLLLLLLFKTWFIKKLSLFCYKFMFKYLEMN